MRTELTGLAGVVERNVYLVKRYAWWEMAFFVYTVASSYTIVLVAKGIERTGGRLDVNRVTTVLLIGAVVWAYLSAVFEVLTDTVPGSAGRERSSTRSWRRWRAPCTCWAWASSPSPTVC